MTIMLVSLVFCLLIIEIVYRYQLIDFYKAEKTYLNSSLKEKKRKKKILVFGDSFTASNHSYLSILNDSFPNIQFINSAMPGIGIQEINVIAKNRIKEYQPDLVLVQFYVGNDLLDIKKPINWSTLNLARNCFWLLSNNLFSLRYINYKLGQFKSSIGQSVETELLQNNDSFSVNKMSKREKLLIKADANHYEKSITISADYEERYQVFLKGVDNLLVLCKQQNVPIKIIVIPANCQVSNEYVLNLTKCGANFSGKNINDTLYPFINRLSKHFYGKDLEILNPLPAFQHAERNGSGLYFKNDLHLNNIGNSVLARFIGNQLKDTLN